MGEKLTDAFGLTDWIDSLYAVNGYVIINLLAVTVVLIDRI